MVLHPIALTGGRPARRRSLRLQIFDDRHGAGDVVRPIELQRLAILDDVLVMALVGERRKGPRVETIAFVARQGLRSSQEKPTSFLS